MAIRKISVPVTVEVDEADYELAYGRDSSDLDAYTAEVAVDAVKTRFEALDWGKVISPEGPPAAAPSLGTEYSLASSKTAAFVAKHAARASEDRRPFVVQIIRTEAIAFQIDADSDEDARDRYLIDGEEVASATTDTIIDAVDEGTSSDILG